MSQYEKARQIRSKKLGLLLYDARIAARRSIEECAEVLGIPPEQYQRFEQGTPPSLPELEIMAYLLDTPLDHFWGNSSLSQAPTVSKTREWSRVTELRQRMIGASIRQARMNHGLSITELAQTVKIPEEILGAYELGEKAIPLPELETIANILGIQIQDLMDQRGPVGSWRIQQQSVQNYLALSQELQEFIGKPVNLPYIELARRLSELSVEKLRSIAEGLLEITY